MHICSTNYIGHGHGYECHSPSMCPSGMLLPRLRRPQAVGQGLHCLDRGALCPSLSGSAAGPPSTRPPRAFPRPGLCRHLRAMSTYTWPFATWPFATSPDLEPAASTSCYAHKYVIMAGQTRVVLLRDGHVPCAARMLAQPAELPNYLTTELFY